MDLIQENRDESPEMDKTLSLLFMDRGLCCLCVFSDAGKYNNGQIST